MQVVILAGGLGSRLSEETHTIPKPMVHIGDKPIISHIINLYASYGYSSFIIAGGYKVEVIANYFEQKSFANLDIRVIDTGLDTQTAGRILRLSNFLKNDFMLTYGDGLANLDLNALEKFHFGQRRLATVTAVHPPPRFGTLEIHEDEVSAFYEKSPVMEGWINGGFMVLSKKVIDLIDQDSDVLERKILPRLAATHQLSAFRHPGWWYAMDTLRDKTHLNTLWESKTAPWLGPKNYISQ